MARGGLVFLRVAIVAWPLRLAAGEGFLSTSRMHHSAELQAAMREVVGCESFSGQVNVTSIEQVLQPLWRSLPKKPGGRVEWRQLRYLTHRYFMQTSSIMIRGLEPTRQVNSSSPGAAEVLNKHSSQWTELLTSGRVATHGYSFRDAVALIATLKQLLLIEENDLLEMIYANRKLSPEHHLKAPELREVLREYMVYWMLGDQVDNSRDLMQELVHNTSMIRENLPQWDSVQHLIDGTVAAMAFARQHKPQPGHGNRTLRQEFSIEDAIAAVTDMTTSFASYWETECQVIKDALVKMDVRKTGRVRLADFYAANLEGDWRFGESEAYLRELGVLDESSEWLGPQVIIPNYLQGVNNCIVVRPHHLVCCVNECEMVLHDIETALDEPVASPEAIVQLVGNMSDYNDDAPNVDKALRTQLQRIADIHGGDKVPLHGRLFAQWLHYVFPQECQFPHRSGTTIHASPAEFDGEFAVTEEDVLRHAAFASAAKGGAPRPKLTGVTDEDVDMQRMSQWSDDEELISDYSAHLRQSWGARQVATSGGLVIAGMLVLAALGSSCVVAGGPNPIEVGLAPPKSHFV